MLFQVLNRGVARMEIFRQEKDFDAFHRVVEQTLRLTPMRICAYCWMPNHWHFVLWPERDGDLSTFMQRMANMHTQRWQRAKLRVGYGHLYQGRFKSFPLETDAHFYHVTRYVERNAQRAGLVQRAEDWKWGSLHRRASHVRDPLLSEWPLPEPSDWIEYVNLPQTEAELEAIRRCVHRGSPYVNSDWTDRVGEQLGLQSTLHGRGRPRKSVS
jgi:putative transposase